MAATATALTVTSLVPSIVSAGIDVNEATGFSKFIGSIFPDSRKKKAAIIEDRVRNMNAELEKLMWLISKFGCSPEHVSTVQNLTKSADVTTKLHQELDAKAAQTKSRTNCYGIRDKGGVYQKLTDMQRDVEQTSREIFTTSMLVRSQITRGYANGIKPVFHDLNQNISEQSDSLGTNTLDVEDPFRDDQSTAQFPSSMVELQELPTQRTDTQVQEDSSLRRTATM